MAARIGNALVDKIFDSSDASKAFKTSWNQGREFVLYGLTGLESLLFPTGVGSHSCNYSALDITLVKVITGA